MRCERLCHDLDCWNEYEHPCHDVYCVPEVIDTIKDPLVRVAAEKVLHIAARRTDNYAPFDDPHDLGKRWGEAFRFSRGYRDRRTS